MGGVAGLGHVCVCAQLVALLHNLRVNALPDPITHTHTATLPRDPIQVCVCACVCDRLACPKRWT